MTLESQLGVHLIRGFKPSLPSIRLQHPARGEAALPRHWLLWGSEPMAGEALSLLLYTSKMRREYDQKTGIQRSVACFSLDGVGPHERSVLPQSTDCESCSQAFQCNFVNTLFVQDETTGFPGIWVLRGMANNRWSAFLSTLKTGNSVESVIFPVRITVRPSLVGAQGSFFTVPIFTSNTKTRLSKTERDTALKVLEDTYDLSRIATDVVVPSEESE